MRIFLVMLLTPALLAGCASQWKDSGIGLCDSEMVNLGPDTYMSSGKYGNGCGYKYNIKHAGVFCSRMGKSILVDNIDKTKEDSSVIFKCLSKNDVELQRPSYNKSPDIIIKHQ